MRSFLEVKDGIYNPSLRFAFTNITDTEFVSYWDKKPIKIGSGVTVELPHHLAVKLTIELVDKIVIEKLKVLDETILPIPLSSLGVPAARKPYEDKILRQLADDEESPEIQILRAKIKEELINDLSKEVSKEQPKAPSFNDFADINKQPEAKPEKKSMRLKTISKKELNNETIKS